MNKSIEALSARMTLSQTSKLLSKVTAELSPIVATSLQLSLMLTLMLMALPGFAKPAVDINATEISITKQSYSSGQSANITNKLSAKQITQAIKQRIQLGDSDQAKNKSIANTRDEIIIQKQQAYKKASNDLANTKVALAKPNSRSFSNGSFAIYEGYSQLIEDYDSDGFYQTFSVTFDADLISYNPYEQAIVYAELYLSENGGPWQHYYTSDSFIIQGDSSDDNFEVYSNLKQGFKPNHYDVLIDLYEVGYPDIIASYSSDDTNSLYALPLESSDYDPEYVEYYEETHFHGGSNSPTGLIVIILVLALRRLNVQSK